MSPDQQLDTIAEQANGGSAFGCFLALMRKSILLKRRAAVSSCIEVLVPVIFALGILGIYMATAATQEPGGNFVPANATTQVIEPVDMLTKMLCYNGAAIAGLQACNATVKASPKFTCFDGKYVPVTGLCAPVTGPEIYFAFLQFNRPRFIPTFDQIVLMKWVAEASMPRRLRTNFRSMFPALINGQKLRLVDNNSTRAFAAHLNATTNLFPYVFDGFSSSIDAAMGAAIQDDIAGETWAIMEVASNWDNHKVTIYQNRSGIPGTDAVRDSGFSQGTGDMLSTTFFASGFLTLQNEVDRFYMTTVLGEQPPLRVAYAPMPFNPYTDNGFYRGVGQNAAFLFALAFLFTVSQLTKRIVEEKENRIREAMMIMGMGAGSFYMSWLVTYLLQNLVTALIIAAIAKLSYLQHSDFFIIFLLFWFFAMSTIALSGLMSTLFSKSRLAALLAPAIYFMIAVPAFAMPETTPGNVLTWLSLLSPTAFGIGAKLLFSYEATGGFTWTQFGQQLDDPNMLTCFVMLLLDTFLYTLLMLYLDAVLPSEWGTRAHPLFCIIEPYRMWKRRSSAKSEEEADGRDVNGVYETLDRSDMPAVRLMGLRKEFDVDGKTFVAVKDLTVDMYEGEVTVLLGHNGAGKTTAMNVMTGMLAADGGDCTIYGHSVTTDLAAVRREVSLCPQHNILFNDMTCAEHLEFYAALKGQNAEQRRASAMEMLTAVDLADKADVFADNLSGGMKRKLSVAIAFVGGNRMVFLDEPTAGMDVAARRHTWDLIKKMSSKHTILLTTHYMDEADLLGNSIAIMSGGRLKCSGSPMFLKSRLGVGYTLSVACESASVTTGVAQLVTSNLPDAEVLTMGGGEITFRLPSASVNGFPKMLSALEECNEVRGHGIGVTTLEEIFLKIASDDHAEAHKDDDEVEMTAAVEVEAENHGALWTAEDSAPVAPGVFAQMLPLMRKRFNYQKRDTRTIIFQVVLPVVCIFIAMLLAGLAFSDSPRQRLNGDAYDGQDLLLANCSAAMSQYAPSNVHIATLAAAGMTHPAQNLSAALLQTEKAHAYERIASIACADSTVAPGPAAMLFANESWRLSAPSAVSYLNALHAQAGTGRKINWDTGVDNLPIGPFGKAYANSINAFIFAMFVMIPFTFIPSTFVTFIVKERECHAKHLQIISGMNFVAYWISNFVFDVLSFTVTTLLSLIIFVIFDREEFVGDGETFGAILTLFMMFGLASVCGAYLCSFAFENHATAQNVTMMANFVVGFLCVLVVYFLTFIESTAEVGKALKWIFRIVPAFCLGDGILNLASINLIKVFTGKVQSPFDMEVIGYDLVYLAVEIPLFAALTFLLDHPARALRQQQLFSEQGAAAEAIEDEDSDVMIERDIVERQQADLLVDNVVTVTNLRKSYPASGKMTEDKLAVRNLSFGVRRGEVFGFLGTNGAGKTTTMSVLCGEILPTRGQITVAGHDVVADAAAARRVVGYCPQFDALHDLMTPEEHLRLYAGLRGLSAAATDRAVEQLLRMCGLDEHRAKLAQMLSGGNKRKLSVAIALIGGPEVVCLDEPSAGMDPMARRGLWNVIEKVASQCSVILTTHHLEEVEVLATRMAIMVAGELKCVGTLPHLKQKFGSGFELQVRVGHHEDEADLEDFVRQHLPHASLQESRNLKVTYALPITAKLSEIFATIEENKVALNITDYSVAQASVEQVFLRIEAAAEAAAMVSPAH
jgi:ABC-type multidrug transport system ATPase subunit